MDPATVLERRIHLIRHGQTEWNNSGRFQGHTDVPLSARGIDQAERLTARMADVPLAICFASDLSRAYDTAAAIACRNNVPLEVDPDLREANKGALEGTYRDPITGMFGDETRTFDDNDVTARPPGGESIADLRERCARFFDRLVARMDTLPEGDLAIVSHGGTMRALMTVLLSLPVEASSSFHFDNCGVTTIRVRQGHPPLLVRYNDCQHLEVEGDVSVG